MDKVLIKEIFDTDFDLGCSMSDLGLFKIRRASRGIVVRGDKIALLKVAKYNYHKFPGGGVEKSETIEDAFKREVQEEVGCSCEIVDQGGIIIEWRDQFKLLQISYVFLANVLGEIGPNKLEPDEIAEGYKLDWVPFNSVLEALENSKPTDYEGKFIILRDKSIFEFYKDKLAEFDKVC
jgi:8-oxo-dGTP diphosphatase